MQVNILHRDPKRLEPLESYDLFFELNFLGKLRSLLLLEWVGHLMVSERIQLRGGVKHYFHILLHVFLLGWHDVPQFETRITEELTLVYHKELVVYLHSNYYMYSC